MAEAYLQSLNEKLKVFSAGTTPSERVHPKAIQVMKEKGIDIHDKKPKDVNNFINKSFDYVITVCDNAKETCPVFSGNVKNRLHIGFDDPAEANGTDEYVISEFRRVRNEIFEKFKEFYDSLHI
jgi:arsenate reductase